MTLFGPTFRTFRTNFRPFPGHFLVIFFLFVGLFHLISRLAQVVSELLDSFRPGSISYRPFKKPAREVPILALDSNNNDDQGLRQRLYADVGRPRPFYRTHHQENVIGQQELIHQNPASLQVKI